MAEQRAQIERWVSFAAGIVAPVTLISALLFYFGYVSARSQYEYFGIDVDTIGLSTQDYVMRSPQPLLVPLLVLTLLAVAGLLLHNAIKPTQTAVRRSLVAAAALLVVGVIALFLYPAIGDVPYYALVVPLVIGLAAAALGYLSYVAAHLADRRPPVILIALLGVVTTTCAFWATATTAAYSGRGLAKSDAENLGRFPAVILDTKERLQLRSPGLEETALRPGAGQTFNYRYRGLRVLVVGDNRLFLVPQRWNPSNTTLVVSLDSSIRVQFQFQNDPP
ncbi:hypothetical protein BWI15_05025 [Kribbella sp. ALI-6-A]|uniref:hypothetical protein n=1 Tax=Kribbella sp. ALI-6-A TaxID=1933817 RepID=UPI00097C5155|nr:hypothetical protein [Kribbella sp. ALI-6-A]ONI76661.1 hypothetical protein BWI15_05025 [Kribbella sp. ALI-6-A]